MLKSKIYNPDTDGEPSDGDIAIGIHLEECTFIGTVEGADNDPILSIRKSVDIKLLEPIDGNKFIRKQPKGATISVDLKDITWLYKKEEVCF